MRVQALQPFATTSGFAYRQGQKMDIPDKEAEQYVNVGLVKRVLSPVEEMVDYAVDHNFRITLTKKTTPEVAAEFEAVCKAKKAKILDKEKGARSAAEKADE